MRGRRRCTAGASWRGARPGAVDRRAGEGNIAFLEKIDLHTHALARPGQGVTMTRVEVDRDSVNDEFVVIRTIHRQNGTVVNAGDAVLDIETSKTTKEIPSPETGVLRMTLRPGDEVATG